ncbi:hypothetical protein KAR91_59980 [Candidatus Pacearchaeota archaeon]|nr:hypothetical protein [Candidatus Pacearchaeota archaeon]
MDDNEKDEGGSVFPNGLTKREYFAAHAPITLEDAEKYLFSTGVKETKFGLILSILADLRFDYADAMIAEGKK